ncbi:hypothetical protein Y032_0754g2060 [Ancylostoma ceylanicum]|uniref:N-acetyltransferase domain-containing protein n=1 Tax=Ancylostoma ceylanicum TaxID=53326 RepID=A0A016WDQ7_9BILA|nr:hypothetical protein Y032_0754g2060 [Ancylostoma ceylanicum]
MEVVTPTYTIRRATMDDYDAFFNIMVDAYTNTEPIAKALNISKEDAGEFVKGFLPHYLPQGYSLVMESDGEAVGIYLIQLIDRPNPIYPSGPDPDLPPKIFLIESIAHKLTENFWDMMPQHFTRCMHALYTAVIPSWHFRGAASALTAAAIRQARDMGADVAFAELLSDHVLRLNNPFGFFELRSIPHSHWKDRKGKPLIKINGANRSVLTVIFLKKTMIDSKL